MKATHKVYLRGDAGQQVLQAYCGAAQYLKSNDDFIFINSVASLPKAFIEKSSIENYFDIKMPLHIDHENINKQPIAVHGLASLVSQNFELLDSVLRPRKPVPSKSYSYAVVYIVDLKEDEASLLELYSKLIFCALSKYSDVIVCGDCSQSLQQNLQIRYQRIVEFCFTSSQRNLWEILGNSAHIYSVPVSFACCHKLYDRKKELTIVSPVDISHLESCLNNYIFISELQKSFGGIETLHPLLPNRSIKIINDNWTGIQKLSDFKSVLYNIISNNPNIDKSNINQKPSNLDSFSSEFCFFPLDNNFNKLPIKSFSQGDAMNNIFKFLKAGLDELSISNSISRKSEHRSIKNQLLSENKSLRPLSLYRKLYPPSVELFGFSIAKHVLANSAYLYGLKSRISLETNEDKKTIGRKFYEDGVVAIPNVFSSSICQEVKNSFESMNGSLFKQANTVMYNDYKSTNIASALKSASFIDIIRFLTGYSEKTVFNEIHQNTFYQTVLLQEKEESSRDPQQSFHIDTFYPAFKFWYFPYEVKSNDAPFEYVLGSHNPSPAVLNHFLQRYEDNAFARGYSISPDNAEGSLRATDSDLGRMNLVGTKVVVPSNTLVIANVGGFHRRSLNTEPICRHAIHSSIRPKNIYDESTYCS